MYDLAIIGGMGSEATAETFQRIVRYTCANHDQEHINLVVLNEAHIPDRTKYIIDGAESPLPYIINSIENAKLLGCKNFIIPCNTSHIFSERYSNVSGIHFINMIDCVLEYSKSINLGYDVCVLGTKGTVKADIYKKSRMADEVNIIYPNGSTQAMIMRCINTIKSGVYEGRCVANEICNSLKSQYDCSRTIFILACTELSLLAEYFDVIVIDALDVLVFNAITSCGYKIKSEFEVKGKLLELNKKYEN